MKPRISMIVLGVDNMERAIAFYQHLGFPKLDSPPSVAFFNLNGTWLGLFGRKELAEDAGVDPKGSGYNSFNLCHKLESEAEVDALMKEAEAAGATITKPAQKTFWGGYAGYFKDPEGHLWEIAHNPFMWVGPEDK